MKRKLLLTAVALLCSAASWGYTTTDLTSAGWTQVTTTDALSSAAAAGNFFVLIDAGTSNYAVAHSLYLGNRMYYQATVNPCEDAGELWNLESTGTANQYNLRNVSSRRYPGGWDNYMFKTTTETNADCPKTFAVNNGKWTVTRSSSGAEVGPWNNDKAVNTNGDTEPKVAGYENVAANKAAGQPGFYIYTMSSSDFLSLSINGAAANNGKNVGYFIKNPSFETGETDGWTLAESGASDRAVRDAKNNTYRMDNSHGYRLFNTWSWGQPITQNITSIPNGRYKLQAVVANSSDGDPAKVYLLANGEHEGITCNTDGGIGVEGYVDVIVTDNSLNIGAVGSNNDADRSYIENGLWWFKADNFRLTYYGNGAEIFAPNPTDFSSSTNVSEGTWYSFTVSDKGYYSINSSEEVTLSYTQIGSKNVEDDDFATLAISEDGTENLLLGAGTFYFKSDVTSGITITSLGNGVQYYAPTPTDFSSSAALTSGMWYAFTVPSNGRYKITVTTAATLSYTQTGSDDADGDLSTINIAASGNKSLTLSEGTFYFKSNANTNVTISACTYTVDAATSPSIVNGSFYNTKTLSSFTTSIGGSTDDADATIGIIGTPVATLSKGASPVATGTLSWSDGTLTATFSDVALTANAEDYNISIPAGAFGYTGHATNSAISIDFKTPVVFDGTYYLFDESNSLFLSRGANYGTRAVVDKYGVAFTWSNTTQLITFLDRAGRSLFFDKNSHDNCWVYTDGAEGKGDDRLMAFTDAGDGKVYLQDAAKAVWILHDNNVLNVPVTSASTATKWTVMTKAEHDAIVNAYPNDNRTSVISEAGISTTASGLDTYLSNFCTSKDKTSLIGTATFSSSAGDWAYTSVRTTQSDDKTTRNPAYGNGCAELFEITGYYSQTINKSNLPAGIYKVTVDGYERRASANESNTLGAEGYNFVSTYLAANGEQVRFADWYDVHTAAKVADSNKADNYPNSMADGKACFTAGYATNEVYVYLDGNTDLTLTVRKTNFVPNCWMMFGNFKLTYYEQTNKQAIIDNKGDITSLINGEFETNITGWTGGKQVTGLARSWRSSSVVNNFMERTESGTMTCTLSNMPAGTYKVVAAARAAAGCKITPQIAGTSGETLVGVGDAQSAASEINMNGVQMPYSALGGFTTNELGHNWQWITATGTLAEDGDLVINFVTDASGKTGSGSWMPIDDVHLYCTHLNAPSTDYTESMSIITENIDVNNTGNASVVTCDIVMSNPNAIISSSAAINGAAGTQINNNLVSGTIANMVLYDGSAYASPAGEYAITSATYYRNIVEDAKATLMLPFALDAASKAKGTAYAPTRYANKNVSFSTVAEPAADVPYVFVPSSVITSLTGSRASVSEGGKNVAGTDVTLYGTYAPTAVTKDDNNYVASAGMLWLVDSDDFYSAPFRAYLHIDDPYAVKSLHMAFDDDPTSINAVKAIKNEGSVIYNLAGLRLNKMQKGVNIINGKKVLVK